MVRVARLFMIFSSVLVLSYLFGAAPAQSQTSQDILKQYVADLQKNPNDYALREKIIKHVQTIRPAPAVPEDARKFMNRGMAAAEGAKNEKEYKDAIEEFQKVVNIAPWLGGAYRNLAVVQDKTGQYSQALQNLGLYLLTNPSAADADAAKTLMDKIEYRQEKAAKESSPQAVAAQKQSKYEEWLKKIDGRRYRESRGGSGELEVRGKFIVLSAPGVSLGPWEIKGRSASTPRVMQRPPLPVQTTFIISEDGDRIIEHRDFSDGDALEFVWVWKR